MRIAVSADGDRLESIVEGRFGRAQFFVIADDVTGRWEVMSNAENCAAGQGAGIATSRALADAGVEAVITGNVGPKALQTLCAAGIQPYAFENGIVGDAIAAFKDGRLKRISLATAAAHRAR